MLVALMTLLFLGGGGDSFLLGRIDALIDNVEAVIQSEDRRKQAVEILKEVEDATKDYQKKQKDHAKDLDDVNESRGFDAKSTDAIWDAMFRDMESYHANLMSRRQDLKSVVHRDEWGRVFAPGAGD